MRQFKEGKKFLILLDWCAVIKSCYHRWIFLTDSYHEITLSLLKKAEDHSLHTMLLLITKQKIHECLSLCLDVGAFCLYGPPPGGLPSHVPHFCFCLELVHLRQWRPHLWLVLPAFTHFPFLWLFAPPVDCLWHKATPEKPNCPDVRIRTTPDQTSKMSIPTS
jgi:hypothetical protein